MRYALFLPIFDALADPIVVARLAAEAEEAGWDGVFVWDHISYRAPVVDVADPWITLAAIASATETIRLGPLVTPLPRRRPVKVARETATLDLLSEGRLTFGVGLGGDRSGELSGTGEELNDRARGQMLDESLDVLTAAWSGEPVHHHGPHYQVDGVQFRPTPIQRPAIPIWVALRYGNSKPLRRAARYQGVFPVDVDSPDQLTEIVEGVAAVRATQTLETPKTLENPYIPYDVAIGGPPGTDPGPFAEAGATWWMVSFDWQTQTRPDLVRAVLRGGPPSNAN